MSRAATGSFHLQVIASDLRRRRGERLVSIPAAMWQWAIQRPGFGTGFATAGA
jgi:hypothetical protein